MSKRVLTVFGGTGNQGGSVVNVVLADKTLSSTFQVRAITRNTNSAKAQSLASKGVELATADLNDPSTLGSALKGTHSVFAVTNFWETNSKPIELSQGKAIADACVDSGVKHLVWSCLPPVSKVTDGKYTNVEHFDSKAEVKDYIESVKGKSGMAASYFMPGYYMPNIKTAIKKQNGIPTFAVPWDLHETQVPMLDPGTDTGTYVAAILAGSIEDTKALDGKSVRAVGEWCTPAQIVGTLKEKTGQDVQFKQIPADVYEGFLPKPVAKDLTEMMEYIRDYSYFGKGSEKEQAENDKILQSVGLKPLNWEEFVVKNSPWEFS